MNHDLISLLCIAGIAAAVAYLAARFLLSDTSSRLRQRLSSAPAPDNAPAPQVTQRFGMRPALSRLGQAAAHPFMPKTRERQSSMRRNLARAGIYSPQAMRAVIGFKLIFMVLGVLFGYLTGLATQHILLGIPIGGIAGYIAPTVWLRQTISRNQRSLSDALPDALDLLVVCVEAGLTIDAAMQRVSEELALAHAALARELSITHMETRVGLSRMEAMRNLGQRTGNAALQSIAAMLVQADRFGTSIADALRIQADSMRATRQFAAEEIAAKASVKMSFPLVLFIFPATFIVLAGPTVMQILKSPLFK